MKRCIPIAIIFCLTGCTSPTSSGGVSWMKPWTWGSTSEAAKAEKLMVKSDAAKDAAIRAAQGTAHETDIALSSAAPSRPVGVAIEANQQTVALLDQVAGPMPVKQANELRKRVADLMSENAEVREQAERDRAKDRESVAVLSTKLSEIQAKLDKANAALPDALRREAELANKYRTLMWGAGIAALLALITFVGFIYLKVMYGGVFTAVGRGLGSIYTAHPDQAQNIELLLKQHLSPSAIAKIMAHT